MKDDFIGMYISEEDKQRNDHERYLKDLVYNSTEYFQSNNDQECYGTITAINYQLGLTIKISTFRSFKKNEDRAKSIMRNLSNQYTLENLNNEILGKNKND